MTAHQQVYPTSYSSRILMMRHPLTEANTKMYFSGRYNTPLAEEGQQQCERAQAALLAWNPDRIYTSPLSRCRSIADPVAEQLGCELIVDERAIEIDFGVLENTRFDLRKASEPPLFPWPLVDGQSQPCEGGESFEELIRRAGELLSEISELSGKTAIVSHGGLIRGLLAAAYQIPLTTFWHMKLANVDSAILRCTPRGFALEAFGLSPEELTTRAQAELEAEA